MFIFARREVILQGQGLHISSIYQRLCGLPEVVISSRLVLIGSNKRNPIQEENDEKIFCFDLIRNL